MVIVIGENFFDGLQVVFGSMLVWSEVGIVFNISLMIQSKAYFEMINKAYGLSHYLHDLRAV